MRVNPESPYWLRRLTWAISATRRHPKEWSLLRWATSLLAFPLSFIIIRSLSDPFPGLYNPFYGFDVSDIIRALISAIISFIILFFINYLRAPGQLDRRHQIEIQSLRHSVDRFEKRLQPSIWMSGCTYNSIDGKCIGFTIENRSDCDLKNVQVKLVKLKAGIPGISKDGKTTYSTAYSGGSLGKWLNLSRFERSMVDLPVLLEWNPNEHDSSGMSCTTIPAGSSCRFGLFYGDIILAANHDIRHSSRTFPVGYAHRIAIELSAQGIRALNSRDYIVARSGLGRLEDIPFEVDPVGPIRLSGDSE